MARVLAAGIAEQAGTIIIACLMLIGAFFVLGLAVWWVRRWQRGSIASSSAPWTLDDLRRMREEGQLSEAEYQRLRTQLIGAYSGRPVTAARRVQSRPQEETWDWIAENPPGADGFDVKKESPG